MRRTLNEAFRLMHLAFSINPGLRVNKGKIFLNHPPDPPGVEMKAEKI